VYISYAYYILSSGTISMYGLESFLHVGSHNAPVYINVYAMAKSMIRNGSVFGCRANICAVMRRIPMTDNMVHIKRIC